MRRMRLNKKAFTLAETMIVCTIFAMMVVGIILGINRAFVFMNNTKLDTIATNLAREGVEMMYNIRDTNWRKHSGEKDKWWLVSHYNPETKEYFYFNSDVGGGIYVIKQSVTGDINVMGGGLAPRSSANCTIEELNRVYDDMDIISTVGYNKCYMLMSDYSDIGIANLSRISKFLGDDVKFYRVVRVYGVYKKDVNGPTTKCAGDCLTDGTPAELRFCVKVFYKSAQGKHAKELCSIMTNFME